MQPWPRVLAIVAVIITTSWLAIAIALHWNPLAGSVSPVTSESAQHDPDPGRIDMPPPPTMPPDVERKIGPDDLFNVILTNNGIVISDGNSAADAAEVGHQICGFLDRGYTPAQIEQDTMDTSRFSNGAPPTRKQVQAFISAAERVYCPQYDKGA